MNWPPKLLKSVGMGDMMHRRVTALSGGERQLVLLARALWRSSPVCC